MLGHIGEGCLGWVLQQTDGDMALQAAERMRACFAGAAFPVLGRVTLPGVTALGSASILVMEQLRRRAETGTPT